MTTDLSQGAGRGTQGKVCSIQYLHNKYLKKRQKGNFLGGPVVMNLPANAVDMGLIPGPGRSYMLQGN